MWPWDQIVRGLHNRGPPGRPGEARKWRWKEVLIPRHHPRVASCVTGREAWHIVPMSSSPGTGHWCPGAFLPKRWLTWVRSWKPGLLASAGWFSQLPGEALNRCQEKTTGTASFTLTLLPASPSESFTSESCVEDALSTSTGQILSCICFHCMPVIKDSHLETSLNRQKRGGSRWGEEKESSDPLAGIKSPPTNALTYGGLIRRLARTPAFTVVPSPLHSEESAYFFWQMIVYLVGQAEFHSSVLSKTWLLNWNEFMIPLMCTSVSLLPLPPTTSPPFTEENVYIYIYIKLRYNWHITY